MANGIRRYFAAVAAALMVSGCGTTGLNLFQDAVVEDPSVKACVDKVEMEKKLKVPDDENAVGFTDTTLNYIDAFLDCIAGPAAGKETKLLRGHAIVAVASRYAQFNAGIRVSGIPDIKLEPYNDLEDDVAATIAAIEAAEYRLRLRSRVIELKNTPKKDRPEFLLDKKTAAHYENINMGYDQYSRVKSVLSVLKVFRNAAQPTYQRTKRTLLRFIAAASGSALSARQALKDATKGLKKYVVLTAIGDNYIADVKAHMKEIDGRANKVPTPKDWERWDKPLIDACNGMANFIDSLHQCVPL